MWGGGRVIKNDMFFIWFVWLIYLFCECDGYAGGGMWVIKLFIFWLICCDWLIDVEWNPALVVDSGINMLYFIGIFLYFICLVLTVYWWWDVGGWVGILFVCFCVDFCWLTRWDYFLICGTGNGLSGWYWWWDVGGWAGNLFVCLAVCIYIKKHRSLLP